ncbi:MULTISPECIES: DUF1453 family protein [Streptomycetaceae]|uniref:Integral membrane protein n=1 Tax=Streptantibioticus cattleyicolor (strain ATCC 35852 / DSM 46488 / JCM 4925 / NBRC 14057 / NRRL 8057) TaxID=1003195 RepID=F8JVQ4_STREN|nr:MULTISPECIES: DUF1453 family protein [Streptomycetaceae]AEW96965.1 integral membrane protein [Streptantibioticus cattleyicolor NRRL 8057 = DSM 46488]MYS61435.1 DUF1453 family protein [Streptomyces sp. SID5468]CCB77291.1 Integral membrane protein [Streptantibioticus cattleyicolor NRRL 8057 = DSM 46488]
MSGLVDAVAIVAVVGLVVSRQLKPQKVADADARWWLMPVVLVVLAVRQHGLTDPHHQVLSAVLLAAGVMVGAGMGAAWGFTTRVWAERDGTVWSRGTKATAAAWAGGIVLRGGLAAVGAMLGVHQGSGSIMLALAATLLVRTGVVVWRARELRSAPRATVLG